jgi:FkbM family methyltransferase
MRVLGHLVGEINRLRAVAGWFCALRYCLACGIALPRIARERSLLPADRWMTGRNWSYRVQGVEVVLDGRFFSGARELYARQVYYALPGFRVRSGDVVVDLGANVGVFTTLAAASGARVVAVEAQSEFFDCIEENLQLNSCRDRVVLEHALVGAESGVFSDVDNLRAASHFAHMPERLGMGELLRRHDVSRIDFLKVDIEGSEFALFAANHGWLDGVQKLAMEVHPEFGQVEQLRSVCASHGMEVELLDARGVRVVELGRTPGYLFAWRGDRER